VIDRLDVLVGNEASDEQSLGETYLASAPLCGRKRALARVQAALNQVLRGRGAMLSVAGEPGAGRTRFLSAVALKAKLRGCLVLHVDASEHDGPYATAQALALELTRFSTEAQLEHARVQAASTPGLPAALSRLCPELAVVLGVAIPTESSLAADEEPTRDRALCLTMLHGLITGAARTQPHAILIDDVHRADEASLGVLGALAHDARRLKLLVAVAHRVGDEAVADAGLRALLQCGGVIDLPLLDERQLEEWLSAVFGDAANLRRLVSFLHQRTRGRPFAVASLVRFLIARGELRHREGAWVLPSEPSDMALPDDVEMAALDRLRAEPQEVRALAEALSMHRGPITLELCAALHGGASEPELRAWLDTLVRCEVLAEGQSGHRFGSEHLREKIAAQIDPSRRTALHLRMGEAILARSGAAPLYRLAAGVHLLEAGDPRGLPLAVEAACHFADRIDGIGSATRLLERALVLAREAGAPAAQQLALLSPLGLGAYVIDHRLARYADLTCEMVDEVAGLPLARSIAALFGRLGRFGYRLGALLGLGIGVLRFYLRPRRERPARYRQVLRQGVAALVAMCGRATICLDKSASDRILAHIAPLRALGLRDPGGFAVEYAETLALATEDRYGLTRERWLWLEDALRRKVALAEVPIEQRRLWTGGVAYGLGVFESFRGDPTALQRAAELEASGSDMHAMIAAQLRVQYHGFRGEAEQVRKAYERMEACAIQIGSSWQVDTWAAISINLYAAAWHDVILAKRAMRETQRMKDAMPSLERYAVSSEATYLLRRGQPRECADLFEPLLAEPAMSRIGWSTSSGLLAEAYNQLGMHAEAKALCERVFSQTRGEDRVYFAMRMAVDIAYAVALAALGEAERAVGYLEELRACYAEHASPVALGSVHEALARIELARGDRKRFTEHLKQVEACFTKLGNPALIARFQALSDLAAEGGGVVSRVAVMREVRAFEAAIESVQDRAAAARAILAWLMRSCEGYDGFLFGPPLEEDAEEPELLAATTEREPTADMFDNVGSALRSLGRRDDITNCGTGAATHTSRGGAASHLFLLSYFEADDLHGEGALVLIGRAPYPPPIRYELLQAAALQLHRLREQSV
jgi:tetratricopeptide (TPR) repeat protein